MKIFLLFFSVCQPYYYFPDVLVGTPTLFERRSLLFKIVRIFSGFTKIRYLRLSTSKTLRLATNIDSATNKLCVASKISVFFYGRIINVCGFFEDAKRGQFRARAKFTKTVCINLVLPPDTESSLSHKISPARNFPESAVKSALAVILRLIFLFQLRSTRGPWVTPPPIPIGLRLEP